jgi:hypothetical protein
MDQNGRMEVSAQAPRSAVTPAWQERGDGKRVWLRGGQAWGQSRAQRDSRGRYLPAKQLDAAGEAERQRRREREAALKAQTQDQRTRIGRRVRAIERDLRNQLRRQGRTVTIDIDLTVGQIAQAAVRIEAFRSQQSRGLAVDDNQFTRLLNISQRGLAKLGLKPSLFDDDRAEPRGLSVARQRWDAEEARKAAQQTATREATTKPTEPPDDGRRATAE